MTKRFGKSSGVQVEALENSDILDMPNILDSGLFRRQNDLMDLGLVPTPLNEIDLPADLLKRQVADYEFTGSMQRYAEPFDRDMLISAIAENVKQIAATQVLSRGLLGRNYTIGTQQVSIARAEKLRGYYFLNPSSSIGLTTSLTALAPTILVTDGNTRNNAIGVATFREAHIIIDLSDTNGGATNVSIFVEAFDSLSGNWATVQQILSTAMVGTYYINVGAMGIATDMAFSWTLTGGAPAAAVSINAILKNGLAGSTTSGLANTLYLGANGVTSTTGYPLLEGQQQSFFLRENLELFAISDIEGVELRVFEL